jgi:hypothetical protein
MRWSLVAVVLGVASPVAAEPAGVEEAATAEAETAAIVRAAGGGGSDGGRAIGAVEVGAELARTDLAVGIAARVRVDGDGLVREDWDEVGDWLALLHHLEWRRSFGDGDGDDPWQRARGVRVAAGQLASLDVGSVAEGMAPGLDADGRHAGVHARLDLSRWSAEAAADDVADPIVVAARVRRFAGPVAIGLQAGLDRAAPDEIGEPMADGILAPIALDAAVAARHGAVTSSLDGGISVETGLGGGVWLGAATAVATTRVRATARLEGTAGTGGWIAAPFGPLYRVLRVDAGTSSGSGDGMAVPLLARARAGDLGGVGGAASLRVEIRDVAAVDGAMRYRPGLGGEARGSVDLAVAGPVRAGAWVAAAPRLGHWAAAGEVRARLGRVDAALEAARLYGDHDGLDAPAGVWQVTAWLGVSAGL